ncbi:hypothetical protein O1611_g8436 [Lasiodiplodia mahajangana]|uniref:Uncharacterized protein n=1 Tax=Lasiodiplodia mahajangana TaxID=1108764 RepID=A0ACC2JCW3_9PEZI|nr:hypothetical protein O1611_g8436 [Lasiodiplodia mahajangana]
MRYCTAILVALATSGFSLVAEKSPYNTRPQCSSKASIPCKCPVGTRYLECVTIGVIGAHISDVEGLVNDFYNISWQLGAEPYKTKGPDNTVGSIRSVRYPLVPDGILTSDVAVEDVDERLVARRVAPDGSFTTTFEQVQASIPYPNGTGVFAGWWGSISGIAATGDETILTWTNWACETAHIRDFAGFHEISFKNATDILTTQGKVRGTNVSPSSAQSF